MDLTVKELIRWGQEFRDLADDGMSYNQIAEAMNGNITLKNVTPGVVGSLVAFNSSLCLQLLAVAENWNQLRVLRESRRLLRDHTRLFFARLNDPNALPPWHLS